MKNVFLVEKSPDPFNSIKAHFEENDIRHTAFRSLEDAMGSQDTPSLVVLLTTDSYDDIINDIDLLKGDTVYARISRVLVLPFNSSVLEAKVKDLDIQALFQIPVEKLKFLTTVSQLLRRGPRRVFRILVTLQQVGSNIRYSGVSIDFSETGIAFESTADFQPGDLLHVQFVNPRNRKRCSLKGAVIRRSGSGSTIFYGMKFASMNERDIKELRNFLTGENKA